MSPGPSLNFSDIASYIRRCDTSLECLDEFPLVSWSTGSAASLAHICSYVAAQRGRDLNVLLPGYFCGQSLRYLRSLDVNIIFYPLTHDLSPDFSYLEKKFMTQRADIFVLVHYFGRITSQEKSQRLAVRYGALLVEDCAHVISPAVADTWCGDYLMFSPHKFFPVPPMGLLISKQPVVTTPRSARHFPLIWIIKNLVKTFVKYRRSAAPSRCQSGQSETVPQRVPHRSVIKAVINCMHKLEQVSRTRQQNIQRLLEAIRTVSGWEVALDPEESKSLYLLPVKCETTAIAKNRYRLLNQTEQIVMYWPDLPFEIKRDRMIEQQCLILREHTLFFMVHHRMNLERVTRIILSSTYKDLV